MKEKDRSENEILHTEGQRSLNKFGMDKLVKSVALRGTLGTSLEIDKGKFFGEPEVVWRCTRVGGDADVTLKERIEVVLNNNVLIIKGKKVEFKGDAPRHKNDGKDLLREAVRRAFDSSKVWCSSHNWWAMA